MKRLPEQHFAHILSGFKELPSTPENVNGVWSMTRRNTVRALEGLAKWIERGGQPPVLLTPQLSEEEIHLITVALKCTAILSDENDWPKQAQKYRHIYKKLEDL